MTAATPDERAFARLLRAYPARWRARHGAAMLGTVLDAAEHEGRTRPSLGERVDFLRHGLAETLLGWLPGRMRDALAQAALGTGLAFALHYFWFFARVPHELRTVLDGTDELYRFGPFANPGVVLCALWLGIVALAMTPWRRALRALIVTTIAMGLLLPFVNELVPAWQGPRSTTLAFFTLLGALALLGARWSRRAIIVGAVAVSGVLLWVCSLNGGGFSDDHGLWYRGISAEVIAWMGVAALVLAGALRLLRYRGAALSVTAFAAPWLPLLLAGYVARERSAGLATAAVLLAGIVLLLLLRYLGVRVTRVIAG